MKFTYERDDGQARSWIDHIICSQSFSSLVSNVNIVNSGSILSDHFPLGFQIQVDCIFTSPSPSSSSTFTHLRVDWSKASSSDLEKFCDWCHRISLLYHLRSLVVALLIVLVIVIFLMIMQIIWCILCFIIPFPLIPALGLNI